MRPYRLKPAEAVEWDLDGIEQHLIESYMGFGDDAARARERAAARMDQAQAYLDSFATRPHRGTLLPMMRPRLRSQTHQGFVMYFEVDDEAHEVRFLAVFFSGMDHRQRMIERLRAS